MGTYFKGNKVRCFAFFEQDGDRINPGSVIFKVKKPDGTIVIYTYGVDVELEKDINDLFSIEISADTQGQWFYRFETSDTYESASESEFIVRKGNF